MATTGFCNSAKTEIMQGGHKFSAPVVVSCTGVSGSFVVTGMPSTAGISSGLNAGGGPHIGTGAKVATVDSSSQVTLSVAASGNFTSISLTGDAFYVSLVNASPSLVYGPTQTNIGTPGTGSPSTANIGTDEVTGTGYVSGGQNLFTNEASLSSTVGIAGWTSNPSWTSATFSTTAGIIYNKGTVAGSPGGHLGTASGSTTGRTIGVIDFGGTQAVSAGTLTLLIPAFTSSTAIIQVN